ncbi:TIGR00159 family protein [Caproiciproducens galactitolivorans]|uniref:Diadenylate cyclase n=1 Tax=Caproiciproducens galactitolivorans TaxID=642589 RepID=A0A4Z0YD45_9FIRM|nr:diadenylate cyclase CdaA [Caproiciproducens galactitolivorans]QEY34409.1 TIGR00159 family protein [Caproiciproducens galactitolivorans]TGJ77818.1 DNA integrity scanning protein DisA [Caproiciproducens galactitolivorans]
MDAVVNIWNSFFSLAKQFRVSDALDVILVSFIIYSGIKLVRETRAEQLVKGILVLLAVWGVSYILKLYMMRNLLAYFFQFSVMALLVVFQPEIRRALEQIGRSGIGNKPWMFGMPQDDYEVLAQQNRKCVNAVVDAAAVLQKQRTGALIIFERKTKLGDIIDTGTVVNAIPSVPIICNIFFNKAPLHDGAMILRDGMVYAAGCILPLTKSDNVSIELGTRHRAGIGMSENSDAVVVIVSEETGQISVAVNGVLTRNYTRETLKSRLENLVLTSETEQSEKRQSFLPSIRRAKKK